MEEHSFWLGFSVFPGIGPGRFTRLLNHFGSAKDAWHAPISELVKIEKIGPKISREFDDFRNNFSIPKYEKELREKNVHYFALPDENYPRLLAQAVNAPFVLFVMGDFAFDPQQTYVGVVGTRKITEYGRQVTEMLVSDLVASGCVIVSGLALGVDGVAHTATVESGGSTVAVLGCGVDCCYPRENQAIYNSILKAGGAIVSEFPPGRQPTVGSFPSRNRIIAGLSEGILVTEGAADSGALITAKDALENNRKVFAVPGPITSALSKGPNQLIERGAKLVSSAEEILSELGIRNYELGEKKKTIKGDTQDEQRVLDLLQNDSLHFDEIVRKLESTPMIVGTLLSMMEMKGFIKTSQAGFFSVNN